MCCFALHENSLQTPMAWKQVVCGRRKDRLMVRHRINLPFLHLIFQFILLFKTIRFRTAIPCQCISLYSSNLCIQWKKLFFKLKTIMILSSLIPQPFQSFHHIAVDIHRICYFTYIDSFCSIQSTLILQFPLSRNRLRATTLSLYHCINIWVDYTGLNHGSSALRLSSFSFIPMTCVFFEFKREISANRKG